MVDRPRIQLKEQIREISPKGLKIDDFIALREEFPNHTDLRIECPYGEFYGGRFMTATPAYWLCGERFETDEEYEARVAQEDAEMEAVASRLQRGVDMYWVVTHRVKNYTPTYSRSTNTAGRLSLTVNRAGSYRATIQETEEEIIANADQSIGVRPTPLSNIQDENDPEFMIMKWCLFDLAAATMFAMMVDGSVREYEWPVKISGLSEEELFNAYFEHVVSQAW